MASPTQAPYVRDVNPGPAGSSPGEFLPFTYAGGETRVLLVAHEPNYGREVRINDPYSTSSVYLLHDVRPGAGSSNPRLLTSFGARFLFLADDGVHGEELFVSGGGLGAHALVSDVREGPGSSHRVGRSGRRSIVWSAAPRTSSPTTASTASSCGGATARRSAPGWSRTPFPAPRARAQGISCRSAGASTSRRATRPDVGCGRRTGPVRGCSSTKHFGTDGTGPQALTPVGTWLSFVSRDGTGTWTLWKTDGTEAGTTPVTDLGSAGAPGELAAMDGILLFSHDDGVHGRELWRSDGTAAGTRLVKDIRPGAGASSPGHSTSFAGVAHFAADDGASGRELWRTDGTEAGTVLAADVNPGAAASSPAELTATSTQLYFAADDGVHGEELWRVVLTPLFDCQPRSLNFGWRGRHRHAAAAHPHPGHRPGLCVGPLEGDAAFVHVAPESGQGSATVTVTFDPAAVSRRLDGGDGQRRGHGRWRRGPGRAPERCR